MSKKSILKTINQTFIVSGSGKNDVEAITIAFNKMKDSAYKNYNNLIVSLSTNDIRDITKVENNKTKKSFITKHQVTLEIDTTISFISRKEE